MVKKYGSKIFLGLMLVFMYLPIIWLIIFSFSNSTSIKVLGKFSLDAYIKLFNGPKSEKIFSALGNTISIALISSFISTILGTLSAIGILKFKRRRTTLLYKNISEIPMVNADIITAVSLMIFFVSVRKLLQGVQISSYLVIVIAHITFSTPYVLLNVLPRMKQFDVSLYEAAIDLGATPFQALRKIIIPQIMPGIVMGFILAFTLSIDDFVITQYNIQGFQTLSTFIYNAAAGKKSLPNEIRALSSIIFITILILLIYINRKTTLNKKKFKEGNK